MAEPRKFEAARPDTESTTTPFFETRVQAIPAGAPNPRPAHEGRSADFMLSAIRTLNLRGGAAQIRSGSPRHREYDHAVFRDAGSESPPLGTFLSLHKRTRERGFFLYRTPRFAGATPRQTKSIRSREAGKRSVRRYRFRTPATVSFYHGSPVLSSAEPRHGLSVPFRCPAHEFRNPALRIFPPADHLVFCEKRV